MDKVRLLQLDGLRGLFSLMVVIYHFPSTEDFAGYVSTSNFMSRQGDLFVDFFFVLSGFVISLNYLNRLTTTLDFGNYLKLRFIRLYPLLLYTTLLFFGFEVLFNVFLPQFVSNPESPSVLLLQTAETLLFVNSTPILGSGPGMNYPSWSISGEMVAYIIFGLGVLYFSHYKKVLFIAALLVCGAFLISINSYMETYKFGFVRAILCFVCGCLTYMAFVKYNKKPLPIFEYLMPVALLILFYVRYYYISDAELFTTLTIPLLFSLSIYVYALSDGYIVKLMASKPFEFLGKISYSMYLNHALVVMLIPKFVFSIIKLPFNELTVSGTLAVSLIIVVIYSYLTYIFIEKKGKKLFSTFFSRKATVTA